jgi:glycosyltransferase involved in cell wall biosynthesis
VSPEPVTISAVIPTFNRLPLLRRALQSIQRQSVQPHEIIVVDDGSTDGTQRVLAHEFPAVRWFRRERAGASAARNFGVRQASGSWIAFLDSDDEWAPSYLEHMTAAITATRGDGAFYFSDVARPASPELGSWWRQCGFNSAAPFQLVRDASDWVIRDLQPMLLPFTVVRKAAYLQTGGLWDRLAAGEDTHLFLKLGLGRSACAVHGEGGCVGEDDDPTNRLTHAHGAETVQHWENVLLMNRDLLETGTVVRAGDRSVLRGRIADAHWRLSRLALRHGAVFPAFKSFVASLSTDPRRLVHSAHKLFPGGGKGEGLAR